VDNVLADPVLELHGAGAFVTITNNNWRDTQEAEITATGIPPTNDLESAILATLDPGAYTAIVRGNGNTAGVALVEVYDLDQAALSKLGNISTRAFCGTGTDIVIAGFMLGNGGGDDRIIVRGLGPSLTAFGVPNAMANPTLELRNGAGTLLISNNDWQDNAAQAAEITAAGLAPGDDLEAAIAATLPPGAYTALLAGLNDGTGIGLVEVYDRGIGATVTVTVGPGGLFQFSPASVTIQPGDTVQWTWSDDFHSSTSGSPGSPSGLWDSGILNKGATFSHTFNTAGSFPYYCTPHGSCCGMTGTVTVSGPTPTPAATDITNRRNH
jgi:plastocyanin